MGIGNKDDLGSVTGATEKSSTWDVGTSSLGRDFSACALAHPTDEESGDDFCSAVRSEAKNRKTKKLIHCGGRAVDLICVRHLHRAKPWLNTQSRSSCLHMACVKN